MRFEDYVLRFGENTVWGRADLAREFGVSLNTAKYHLERAVKNGKLHKQYGWLGQQSGWLYALPEKMPKMKGL